MKLTKRNHSNPCSWIAFWNEEYYLHKCINPSEILNTRKQRISSLNVRVDKVLSTTVNNVHFDKNIGIAEITPDTAKAFCKKFFPDEYDKFEKYMVSHPETLLMDFEQILNRIENTAAYETLLSVVVKQRIDTREEVANLSCFIVFQNLRSHAVLRSMLEYSEVIGLERFEYFWLLKNALGNTEYLYTLTLPLATSQWIIYKAAKHTFPLPDTPVLIKPKNVMIALSPRMLAEIDLNVSRPEGSWIEKDYIPKSKLREYRRRAISSTFKEIIFNDKSLLEEWRGLPEFRKRVTVLSNFDSYVDLVLKSQSKI